MCFISKMKQAAHIRRAQELLTAPALGDTKRFGRVIASGKIVGGGWPPRKRILEPQYPPPPGIIIKTRIKKIYAFLKCQILQDMINYL